jgi:hypothetical protein
VRRYRAEATYCARGCDIYRTEVLCAVSRLVVVRPVGAAPVRCVYSRPEAPPQADYILYNPLVTALEEPRPGPGWCTGSAQAHCREHCRITKTPQCGAAISEVFHLQGPSDLLCALLVAGVAVVMPRLRCWRLVVPKLDVFCVFLCGGDPAL